MISPRNAGSNGRRATDASEGKPDKERFLHTDVGRFGHDDKGATDPPVREPAAGVANFFEALWVQHEVVRRAWAKKRRLHVRTEQAAPPNPGGAPAGPLRYHATQLAKQLLVVGVELTLRLLAIAKRMLLKKRDPARA